MPLDRRLSNHLSRVQIWRPRPSRFPSICDFLLDVSSHMSLHPEDDSGPPACLGISSMPTFTFIIHIRPPQDTSTCSAPYCRLRATDLDAALSRRPQPALPASFSIFVASLRRTSSRLVCWKLSCGGCWSGSGRVSRLCKYLSYPCSECQCRQQHASSNI